MYFPPFENQPDLNLSNPNEIHENSKLCQYCHSSAPSPPV